MNDTDLQPATSSRVLTAADVPSMLLPVADRLLLLPGVSVAEIVNYSYVERPEQAPDWLIGQIGWRKLTVPLVCFEVLNGGEVPRMAASRRIAVLNSTGVSDEVPFIAVVIQSIPRLLRVTPKDISEDDSTTGPAELAAVRITGGETVFIPDVAVLERAWQDWQRQH